MADEEAVVEFDIIKNLKLFLWEQQIIYVKLEKQKVVMREKGTLDSSGLVYNKVREFCYCVMWILTRHDALLYKLLPSSPLLQTELEDCESAETQRSKLDFYHSEPSPLSQLTTISGFNCETCQTSNKTKYSLFLDQYTTPKAQQ